MSLEKQLRDDMISALKAKDEIKKQTLRLLVSDIKKISIDTKEELKDPDILKLIKTGIKKRKEAAELFKQGNRQELVDKANDEIKVLEVYLPKQLSKEELESIVEQTMNEIGAKEPKDIGKVMKEVMSKYGSQTDGKSVQQIVSAKINKNKPDIE